MRGSLRVNRPRPSARIARALPALSAQLQLLSRQIAALQAASPPRLPFRDVWAWWKVAYLPGRERRVEFVRLVERDLLPTLGELRELLPEHVEAVLRVLEAKGLGPASVNKRRSALKRVLSDAIANGRWVGANPVLATHPRPVPRRAWPTLSVPEAAALLARPKEPLRALWALALYLGLRKGELFALRRRDVELAAGRIIVARSHERATTKTGKTRVPPICPAWISLTRRPFAPPGYPSRAVHRFWQFFSTNWTRRRTAHRETGTPLARLEMLPPPLCWLTPRHTNPLSRAQVRALARLEMRRGCGGSLTSRHTNPPPPRRV